MTGVQTCALPIFVYVADEQGGNHIAKKQIIKTGSEYNGNIMVTEGLTYGTKLVTFGFQELTDGQSISY